MNKMTIVLMVALMAAVFVCGCADNDTPAAVSPPADDTRAPVVPAADERDALSGEISEDMDDVESLSSDLEDKDVENLDEEFENIDW